MATKVPQLLVFSAFLVFACVNLWAQGVSSFVVNGEAARRRGERSDAERNFKSAIALDERAGDLSAEARVETCRQISYTWAEYAPAMRYFRQAEKLAVAAKDKREVGEGLGLSRSVLLACRQGRRRRNAADRCSRSL